jgi:MraZ protein
VARFFGSFEHTLDGKGRLILPAAFRADFPDGGLLSEQVNGCVALWTEAKFKEQLDVRLDESTQSPVELAKARVWAATSRVVDIDKQGRMVIPQTLREFGGLQGDVVVNGAMDRIELWNPDRWQRVVAMARAAAAAAEGLGTELGA